MREALAYADALHDFAYHLSGNATEADDLVQETYARALGAAEQFVLGSNLKAWLFRILRHLFIDNYRRQRDRQTDGGLDTTDAEAPRGRLPRRTSLDRGSSNRWWDTSSRPRS